MKTFFVSLLGGFVSLLLFVLLIVGAVTMAVSGEEAEPGNVVLEIDLRTEMSDQPAIGGPSLLFASGAFTDVLQKLDAAQNDPKVKGVYIRASEMGIGNSRAEELRSAILRLRESGKFVVAHTQGFLAAGPSALRSISAADEIWLQPGSDIMLPGMTVETLFLKGLFDNLSIKAEIEQFYEYKNSPNIYKETDYTEPHREAMLALMTDIWDVSLVDMAQDRGFASEAQLRALLEEGPVSPNQAVATGLVTGLNWPEDVSEAVLDRAGDGAELLNILNYEAPAVSRNAPVIAIVGGEGTIVTGAATPGPFGGDAIFASDRVAQALLDAGKDEDVRAIVFRIDSGGGSAIASDQIWRAVQRVREEMDKPVIVSMGSVAASGGYYVAAGADAIFALKTTITGSIGVYGGKYALAEGLRQIGINPSTLVVGGDFATTFSLSEFTDSQREKLHVSLERTYDRFMEIVAEGREIDESRVREIARGRVWSGVDAAERDLVTDIGGLIEAIDKARELADIPADSKIATVYYPAPPNLGDMIAEFFGASADTAEAAARLNTLMSNKQIKALIEQSSALQSHQIQMRAPMMIEN